MGSKSIRNISKLADTLMDRAIILELCRRLPGERIANILEVPLDSLFYGVSLGNATLANNITVLLEQLNEADRIFLRIFLLEQIQIWVKKLSENKQKSPPNKLSK